MRRLLLAALLASPVLGFSAPAQAEDTLSPLHFQSQSLLGGNDLAAVQRGFLVYQSVCASCHSASALHYRAGNLAGTRRSATTMTTAASGIP